MGSKTRSLGTEGPGRDRRRRLTWSRSDPQALQATEACTGSAAARSTNQATIAEDGQNTRLGYFDTIEEAARAYARAYLTQHGGPPAPPAPGSGSSKPQKGKKKKR